LPSALFSCGSFSCLKGTIFNFPRGKSMCDSLRGKVARTISEHRMVAPGDSVVAAVSGGADSVCLLDCLNSLADDFEISLLVAHFNHGLRPGEDCIESDFVRRLADSLDLRCMINKSPPGIERKGSEEESARNVRYKFLEEVRRCSGSHRIALGHTIDDQAETVLMRLLRGSGSTGLAAIPPVRGETIIRPIIRVSRREVLEYLKERRLDHMLDSSNRDVRYLRNRIRSELMPLLLSYQPNLVERLSNTADIVRLDDDCLESIASSWIEAHGVQTPACHRIPVSLWRLLHPALKARVLRELISRAGSLRRIDSGHLRAIALLAESASPQGHINLPAGLVARRSYDELGITHRFFKPAPFRHELKGPGTFAFADIGWEVHISETSTFRGLKVPGTPLEAHLDMDLLSFPLVLRSFRPGDRFVPLGMKGGKKVKDFFIDMKLPSHERSVTPILASEGRIVWICGLRLDERFKVTENTGSVLRVSLNRLRGQ
jgi:tRNA(Ile)-lysidine synthase